MRHKHWMLGLVLALAVAACGADAEDPDPAVDEPEETAEPEDEAEAADPSATTVQVADSDLGSIVVDQDGLTLYMFEPDEGGVPTCYDDCAATWPPLEGPAEAGEGVDAGALGTAEREDGTTQVTLGGWPLYYFAGDTGAGDVNGQGVNEVWWAIDGSGNPVQDGEAAQDTGSRDY